jgi:hypothetical protein
MKAGQQAEGGVEGKDEMEQGRGEAEWGEERGEGS